KIGGSKRPGPELHPQAVFRLPNQTRDEKPEEEEKKVRNRDNLRIPLKDGKIKLLC
ncbi:hypothetical protein RUM43_009882, partial [Polyplax serrata]